MQRYQLFIRCRELPAAHAEYTYTVNAGTFHVAVMYAIKQFRREPRVARRHLVCLEIRATVLGPATQRHEFLLPLGDGTDGGV